MEIKSKIIISTTVATLLFTGCTIKPQPIPQNEIKEDVTKSLAEIQKITEPITKPISLDEAINRAVKHNLSRKLDILTSALEEQKIDIAAFEALPDLTAKAGYAKRNNYDASQSVPFEDGKPGDKTDSYSISQDKESTSTSIGFSWNILDFGLSYVRANQQANKFLIAKEKEKKSIQNIREEVRSVYYKAVSADELLKRLKPIMKETQNALRDSQTISSLKIDSPLKALTYQRELLEVIRALNTLEENLIKSKVELSRLMGLKPGTQFELAEKIKEKYELPTISVPVEKLEKIALEYRPELQETRYQERISEDEIKTAMLQMLPGINLTAGINYDDNQYLLNNNWSSYGANISWNLLSVFNGPLKHKLAKTQLELAKQQKVALSMAVVSQVHLSLLDFYQAKKEYDLSEKYFSVAKDIYNIIENENALDVNGKLSLIKEKLNYLIANLRLSTSYAKVQNAYGKVISSIGKDSLDEKTAISEDMEIKKPLVVKKEEKEAVLPLKEEKTTPVKEEKTEPKKVAVVKETKVNKNSFDETKPTIEIVKQAEIVKLPNNNETAIKTVNAKEKLNYIRKVYTEKNEYWYQIGENEYINANSVKADK